MGELIRSSLIIKEVAESLEIDTDTVNKVIHEYLSEVKSHVASGNYVSIRGFGTISASGAFERSDGQGKVQQYRCRIRFTSHESFKRLIDVGINKK